MTEAASSITFLQLRAPGQPPDGSLPPNCVGAVAPGMQVCVVRARQLGDGEQGGGDAYARAGSGAEAGPSSSAVGVGVGEEGEVLVRGAQVFSGYWGDERATASALLVRSTTLALCCAPSRCIS